MMFSTRVIRPLALGFALLLLLLVLVANIGLAGPWFGPLYDFPYGDKVAHFLLIGVLALLVSLGFSDRRVRVLGRFNLLRGSLILAGLVTLEEFSQLFQGARTFSLVDLAAGLAGIYLFGELGAALREKKQTDADEQITENTGGQ
jgi:polysaccharide biosynthesis protein VpsQ